MVRLRVGDILRKKRKTAYWLAVTAGFTTTRAYRLARPDGRFSRIDADSIETLCRVLRVKPGELFRNGN
ncbi:MAG TPA: helix-turn-helix transcriptional regulator [Gemmatimonadales bacterium]|nr:helix-turn-helix transcriptional regulator [Gemmatimonadales bacterium]